MLDDITSSDAAPVIETAAPQPLVAWAPTAVPGGSTHAVPGAPGLEYAGALPRVAAYLLDTILLGLLIVAGVFLVSFLGPGLITSVVLGLGLIAVQAVYFVLGWRSRGRATPGMRMLKLQIGRVADGQTISASQALARWFALTGWGAVLSSIPATSSLASLLSLVWVIVLLVSVVRNPLRQGVHDKLIGTALVRPVGASSGAAWIIVIGLVVAIPLLVIITLIFLGSQVNGILSTVGQPQ